MLCSKIPSSTCLLTSFESESLAILLLYLRIFLRHSYLVSRRKLFPSHPSFRESAFSVAGAHLLILTGRHVPRSRVVTSAPLALG